MELAFQGDKSAIRWAKFVNAVDVDFKPGKGAEMLSCRPRQKDLVFSPEEAHRRHAVALVTSAMAVAQVRQPPWLHFLQCISPEYIPPSPAKNAT